MYLIPLRLCLTPTSCRYNVKLLSNFCLAITSFRNCTDVMSSYLLMSYIHIFVQTNIAIVYVNILAHRYLLEKATVMHHAMETRKGEVLLQYLSHALKLEVYFFFVIPLSMVLFVLRLFVPFVIFGALAVTATLLSHTSFSVAAMRIFLRPVLLALRLPDDVELQNEVDSRRNRLLLRARFECLAGIMFVVVGSFGLYLNYILAYADWQRFDENPWLNPFVTGGNVFSIMVDVGMLFVSGMAMGMLQKRDEVSKTGTGLPVL